MGRPNMASRPAACFEHGHIVTALHQLIGAREARNARADDNYFFLCGKSDHGIGGPTCDRSPGGSQYIAAVHSRRIHQGRFREACYLQDVMTWLTWSLLSAFFAAITAILAKLGVSKVDPNLATAVRT